MERYSKLKRCILIGVVCAAAAIVISWLLTSESSPLYEYFIHHTTVKNLWNLLNVVPYIVSGIVAGNPHAPSESIFWTLLIIQWFTLGFLVAYIVLLLSGESRGRTY